MLKLLPLAEPFFSAASGKNIEFLLIEPGESCTIGRSRAHCDVIFYDHKVSRRHCQIHYEFNSGEIKIYDGIRCRCAISSDVQEDGRFLFCSCLKLKGKSKHGISVNGERVINSMPLSNGNTVSLLTSSESEISIGFKVIFLYENEMKWLWPQVAVDQPSSPMKRKYGIVDNAHKSCGLLQRLKFHCNVGEIVRLAASQPEDEYIDNVNTTEVSCQSRQADCEEKQEEAAGEIEENQGYSLLDNSNGAQFCLNKLLLHPPERCNEVSLHEILSPVNDIQAMFLATFSLDLDWFLDYLKPTSIPCTISTHNSTNSWNKSSAARVENPYPEDWPNLTLIYPPMSDASRFGSSSSATSSTGIGCHHPKFFLVFRASSLRVIITSANLTPRQWFQISNTVWWQDFPLMHTPDYESLCCRNNKSSPNCVAKSDFALQLSYILSKLTAPCPLALSSHKWIARLSRFNFDAASASLVVSVPGIHWQPWQSKSDLEIGSMVTSAVGIKQAVQSKPWLHAALLNGSQVLEMHNTERIKVELQRMPSHASDPNAISVGLITSEDNDDGSTTDPDFVMLGFLGRQLAQWLSPLLDSGLVRVEAWIDRLEAVQVAAGQADTWTLPVRLVFCKGLSFGELSQQCEADESVQGAFLCFLAAMDQPTGLWRLHQLLSAHTWEDSIESDFLYATSSVGTSIDASFLAAFSSACGKGMPQQGKDSEESDPQWGFWNEQAERKNPSVGIVYPTLSTVLGAIDSAKNGAQTAGKCEEHAMASCSTLGLNKGTWERLRSSAMFHDFVADPPSRAGFPTHSKIIRRRFQAMADPKKDQQSSDTPAHGWLYCGSHNFSPAAWGRPQKLTKRHSPLFSQSQTDTYPPALGQALLVCNYELGLLFVEPIGCTGKGIDRFSLSFRVPAPRYSSSDEAAIGRDLRLTLRREEAAAMDNEEHVEVIEEEVKVVDVVLLESEEERNEQELYADSIWSQIQD